MRRLLLTVNAKKCAFGCRYCFADFSDYVVPPSLDDVEEGEVDLHGVDLVYPACDVDLFAMRRWRSVLERTVALGRSISVSTKAALSPEMIEALAGWRDELERSSAVLKVGVSASTKSRCHEIEPRAALWRQRVENLRGLSEAGIPSCLILKPLLPDIDLVEYLEMLDEAAPYTVRVLVGDEYVDADHARRRWSPVGSEPLALRRVAWTQGRQLWWLREARERVQAIEERGHELGVRVFSSDLDLVCDVVDERAAAIRQ